jgi:hypothetical protein
VINLGGPLAMPAYTSTQASSPCSMAQTSTYSAAGAGRVARRGPYTIACIFRSMVPVENLVCQSRP